MCDRRDVGSAVDAGVDGATFHPTIFVYDNYPGGIGMSRPLYEIREQVLDATQQLIASCPCQDGCPSCVGPVIHSKEVALALLAIVREHA
jgi:DEAD/DEAH box helicase domain-containing protein